MAAARTPAWPKYCWTEKALGNLGHAVTRTTKFAELRPAFTENDLVILGHHNTFEHWPNVREAHANRTARSCYLWFDLVYTQPGKSLEEQPIFRTCRPVFEAVDFAFVKERDKLDEYRRLGINAHWLDQGCPAHLREVPRCEPEFDMLVYGQVGHYVERQQGAIAVAKAGFKVAWATDQFVPPGIKLLPKVHPEQLPATVGRARCALSCGRRNDLDGYVSDGFWLALGMGACVIRKATPGLPDGPYLSYRHDDELVEHVRWVREEPEAAAAMGRRAREWVLSNHTYEHRLRELIAIVGSPS